MPWERGGGATVTSTEEPLTRVRETAAEIVSGLRELLGTDDVLPRLDPVGFGAALRRAAFSLAGRPLPVARVTLDYCGGTGRAAVASVLRAAGVDVPGPAEVADDDRRYRDPAYTSNAWFYLSRQQHALFAGYLRALFEHAEVDDRTRAKVDFALGQITDATAPANFPMTNPTVLKRAFDTGGQSLLHGLRNMVRDLATNQGLPRQVTPGQFTVGRELAATPGKVVFRNRLIELIQYAAQTDTVHQVPMLFSPPWINKYYVMDLAPGKSLVEWAVKHGHTCFMISYRNPDESLRDVGMADYLREGPLAALEVIEEITGEPAANVVALCLGGTLATATAAWLAARRRPGVASLTLMNTLLDFEVPGQLGVFADPEAVANLSRLMRRDGYLPAQSMKATFDALRATDLVWNYVVNDWLLGADPAPFDLLTWNADSTRMPATMQTEYLRTCYLENQLAKGKMELAGERLDLSDVQQDAYVITAESDHIAPWRSVYTGARLLAGPVRFVLSNSGHIAGVVNPPGPKSRHWCAEGADLPADVADWRAAAVERTASWWTDWTPWIEARAGRRGRPPELGSAAHPPLADAPGSYVHA
jgi:polyhydroxyalkanoate synthase